MSGVENKKTKRRQKKKVSVTKAAEASGGLNQFYAISNLIF